jgi:GH15 family glucan-1,4-alpha-glucosidase
MSSPDLDVVGTCWAAQHRPDLIAKRAGPSSESRAWLALFNTMLPRHNHVGLLSEDIDPQSGELWVDIPQTYSQARLILSAMRLSRSWEEGLWHAS